ncbi:MAG: BMP family ABC transporter substrate-binding protein, partial [Saezia sp.]
MSDINKRDFIKLASYTAIAGIGGLLVACGDDKKPSPGTAPAPAGSTAPTTSADPLKIGFVYIGPVGDGGWTYAHDVGRKHIESVFGNKIKTSYVESVKEGADAERVF